MGSSEDLAGKIGEALRHPKADLLFEIGLEEPTPTQAARAARAQGLSNEEEKFAKKVAVFKRDHGAGWFGALREIIETTETENREMGLTEAKKKWLLSLTPEELEEALDVLVPTKFVTFNKYVTTFPARFPDLKLSDLIPQKDEFDPKKVKEEHLMNPAWATRGGVTSTDDYCLFQTLGMRSEEVLECIPDPEPGHENYLLVVNCLPLAKLMKFVVVDGKRGKSFLNENRIEDIVEVPKMLFYWRYDIEKGEKKEKLTAREAVCLAIQNTDVLGGRGAWAFGSRYRPAKGASKQVPYVSCLHSDRPELRSDFAEYEYSKWGSA